jgi:hypothetical protein
MSSHVGLLMYATNSTGLLIGDPLKSNPTNKRENHLGQWQVRASDPYQVGNRHTLSGHWIADTANQRAHHFRDSAVA